MGLSKASQSWYVPPHCFTPILIIFVVKGINILNVDLPEIMVSVDGEPCAINPNLVTSSVSAMVISHISYVLF